MKQIDNILPSSVSLDQPDLEPILAQVPGKWGVVLLCDRDGAPIQLICTRNMRAMLRRRFEPPIEQDAPSKRLDYRSLVGRLRWRRVDSELEMDWIYIEAARACFPVHWRGLIPDRRAHFVKIDPGQTFPEFERITEPEGVGMIFGPFVDKTKADRWIDQLRDAFDLCRYHNLLVQSPNAKACAYKQMGKCPAPCDGTVTVEAYRENVDRAVALAANPKAGLDSLALEMKRLAAALEFEAAGRAKARIDLLNTLGGGSFRSIRLLGAFDYVSIQPGPRKGTAKLFRVTASGVSELAGLLGEEIELSMIRQLLSLPAAPSEIPSGVLLGAVCFHLGSSRMAARFLGADQIEPDLLRRAIRTAMKVQPVEEDAETIRETAIPT